GMVVVMYIGCASRRPFFARTSEAVPTSYPYEKAGPRDRAARLLSRTTGPARQVERRRSTHSAVPTANTISPATTDGTGRVAASSRQSASPSTGTARGGAPSSRRRVSAEAFAIADYTRTPK